MTKSELVDAISSRAELNKTRAEQVVNCVFEAMAEALCSGEGIEIRGFGSLKAKTHRPYQGRNPRTGRTVDVPPKIRPKFKVGKDLRELVNESRALHPIRDGKESND